MGMFKEARAGANDRLSGMGMGEFGEDPEVAQTADPAAELMSLIDMVPDPNLAGQLRAAASAAVGRPAPDAPEEGPLANDPVVGP